MDTVQNICILLAKEGFRYLLGHLLLAILLTMFGVSSVYLAANDDYATEPVQYVSIDGCKDPTRSTL
ncbi:hypothetical protein [Yersinia ruckeri]|uniref:hypothetical protein n=1 Tax=Yersinia ruckeri TaxID=29486 RepID=UPI0022384870|nr:hypothetical protein [Yersinia ruckeri]MCW6598780.1 hypothetical protein [Yersinia ruckeri]